MFKELDNQANKLLATAYLLDGAEARIYLRNDKENGKIFKEILDQLEEREVEENIALMGTILRELI